jgi:capsule polysaccharide export protein KpsE/RkpR
LFEDVVVEPSLAIFHEINEIYMFYQEKSLVSVDLVSILKNELTQKSAHTKRVRISNPDTPVKKRNKGTRKKG